MNWKIWTWWMPFWLLAFTSWAAEKYRIEIDLQHPKDGMVEVVVYPPKVEEEFATFIIPITAYGGSGESKLEHWISDFRVLDKAGRPIPHQYISNNGIAIKYAPHIHEIRYWVKDASRLANVYQSHVANIRPGRSYILNHHGFYGFLMQYAQYPYELVVHKPNGFYGASALGLEVLNDTTDYAYTDTYFELIEKPILYAKPDTTSFKIGHTAIHISVYSESGKVTALQMDYTLRPLLKALDQLMPFIPVERYDFVMYFTKRNRYPIANGQYGGLMCSSSSFYILPELYDARKFKKLVQRIAAHEFLHLLSPYWLHSERTQHIGFSSLQMSEHLWLYEGVTEYLSLLTMVRYGFLSESEFYEEISQKIEASTDYPKMSLTHTSEHIFQRRNQENYQNIYYRGMLVAMLLDLHLITEGQQHPDRPIKSLLDLLEHFLAKYKPNRPFKDADFFEEIYSLTSPATRSFIEKYVIGRQDLPYNKYFKKVGIDYFDRLETQYGSFGKFLIAPDYKHNTFVFYNVQRNSLGVQKGDQLLEINRKQVKMKDFNERRLLLLQPALNWPVNALVLRDGKEVLLEGIPDPVDYIDLFVLKVQKKARKEAVELRGKWLGRFDDGTIDD